MELLGLYLYAYLVGSFPTTYIIGKLLRGMDIRRYGSGNVGVTNLSHHVGKRWLAPLILFEMLVKGASPVLVGRFLLGLELASLTLALVGLLTIAGNNWSVFLRFKGGRGIAVAGGTLLALTPLALVGFAIVFLSGWLLTRNAGLWTLLGLAALPFWALALAQLPLWVLALPGVGTVTWWYCAALLALLVLKRLLSNREPLPPEMSRKRVLLNRFLLDRDVEDRAEWIGRAPSRQD